MRPSLSIGHRTVAAQGKFFSRSGCKFLLTATRLDGFGTTLDLNEKLKLRHRLEVLKAAHTSGLILTEEQSQPALDIVAAAGMVALVEFPIGSDDLADPSRFAELVSQVAHAGNVYRSHPALLGYLIDCSLETDTSPNGLVTPPTRKSDAGSAHWSGYSRSTPRMRSSQSSIDGLLSLPS